MRLVYLTSLVFCNLKSVFSCDVATEMELDRRYENLTTRGRLISDLYQFYSNHSHPPPAYRIVLSAENATIKNPFTVTVVRGKSILNVALPRVQPHHNRNFPYWFSSDTLCDKDRTAEHLSQPVLVSVASSTPTQFALKVKSVDNFVIGDKAVISKASPPEPRLHLYVFPEGVDKVFLKATSDSDVCAKLMARSANCPAFDSVGLAEFSNAYLYQSFTTFGGFYVKREEIGSSFHIIFSVSPDDSVCQTNSDLAKNPGRIKKATLTVIPVSDEYILAALPIILYFTSVIVVILFSYCYSKWLDKQENNEPNILEGTETEGSAMVNKIWLFDKLTKTVSHKEYEKQRLVRESKYFNFLYFQIFGALLPALTTLFQNQKKTFKKTHLDTCYFNFLCSLEFLGFRSFNSMASASSLLTISIVNLILVFRKKLFRSENPRMPTTHGVQKRDAPKVVCILSIAALGILWTVASNCPHQTTIPLFAYTFAWLFLSAFMWVYSKRHGVRKWQQMFIAVVASLFGMFFLVENMLNLSATILIVMKVLFLIVSNVCVWVFCYKYLYERPSGIQTHQWITNPFQRSVTILSDNSDVYHPLTSKKVFVAALVANSLIWSFLPLVATGYGITLCIHRTAESQLAIYLIYYFIQKIRFERKTFKRCYLLNMCTLSLVIVTSIVFWQYISSYKMPRNPFLSPALSRARNTECLISGIDWNDIRRYHTSFICILFIVLMDYMDSNLNGVPKKYIFVF